MNYIKVTVALEDIDPFRDMLVFYLNEIGFESHVETETGLESFIQEKSYDENQLKQVLSVLDTKSRWSSEVIEQENWNEKWESAFDPVVVNEKCHIIAPFHERPNIPYPILVSPKMAFGTGHHATTLQIARHLFTTELEGKTLLDMGAGTGVLAIIAEKLGAQSIQAVDFDEWAYENCLENVTLNDCSEVEVIHGGAEVLGERSFNVILANINKNVLLADMKRYCDVLDNQDTIVFSGFYTPDVQDIVQEGEKYGLIFVSSSELNDWAMVVMQKR